LRGQWGTSQDLLNLLLLRPEKLISRPHRAKSTSVFSCLLQEL
jgi:hypothetical protein